MLTFLVAFHGKGIDTCYLVLCYSIVPELVHRDLRSPNVLRGEDKRWFVIDFEVAGVIDEYEISFTILLLTQYLDS